MALSFESVIGEAETVRELDGLPGSKPAWSLS